MQAHRIAPPAFALNRLVAAVCLGSFMALSAVAQTTQNSGETVEIQRLIKDGQHAQALKLIDESLAKNPKDAQMRFRRGVALSMLDRKAEALSVFQKLVEDHPEMPAPYNNMAVIYGAQGEYDKARGALERAIRTNPAYATAYQNLGDVYAQLASQAYSKALQLDKSDTSVTPKLALLRELTTGTAGNASPAAPAKRDPVVAAAPAVSPSPAPVPAPAPAVTTTKPTVPTATPPTPPASAPAAAKPVATANSVADVESAVKSWAAAWSKRDMQGYFAAYAPDYVGKSGSRKAWEQNRRDRIASRQSIKVDISNLHVTVNGDKATAQFRQRYESDALSNTSSKTLQLVKSSNGRWVIQQESGGG
ncbi:nuclear transport factor 2 family protein [Ideonella paludis]|nr:tetratricopeptide repeat protein [Ideonella paludis]